MKNNIYIHFPFCKTRCDYCNFYSQTSKSNYKDYSEYINLLLHEIQLQKNFLTSNNIDNLYLGGGTPSVFNIELIIKLLDYIYKIFNVSSNAEITIEVNPDDITPDYVKELSQNSPINRVSVGIQSFNDIELKSVNRRHTSLQAKKALENINKYFDNFSLDLIYGLPYQTLKSFKDNIDTALLFNPKHISAYALTIEETSPLYKNILANKNNLKLNIPSEEFTIECYHLINNILKDHGFIQYEISNYCIKDYKAKHNSCYWDIDNGYLGLGAGAHSYNGELRQYNIPSLIKYKSNLSNNNYYSQEKITKKMKYNEYIMLKLRTNNGINLNYINKKFGTDFYNNTLAELKNIKPEHLVNNLSTIENNDNIILNTEGLLFADYYASLSFEL
ncbi:MAG: radical SAM family heme chaperone HemW [Bacteroidales bacterium]|jgi:oxygen-independent coproporphyrinogen-3 oxidase